MAARPKGKRPPRAKLVRRWLAVGALVLVAYLYSHPLLAYLEAREAMSGRAAEVDALRAEKRALERRLEAQRSTAALVREARRLAYVQPGERLFIVKGIPEWRSAHASTIQGDG